MSLLEAAGNTVGNATSSTPTQELASLVAILAMALVGVLIVTTRIAWNNYIRTRGILSRRTTRNFSFLSWISSVAFILTLTLVLVYVPQIPDWGLWILSSILAGLILVVTLYYTLRSEIRPAEFVGAWYLTAFLLFVSSLVFCLVAISGVADTALGMAFFRGPMGFNFGRVALADALTLLYFGFLNIGGAFVIQHIGILGDNE